MDWTYLVLFVLFVCALVPIFGRWDESVWLIFPAMCLAFGIGVSEVYDSDLPKVLTLALINALVAIIYASSHPYVPLWQCVCAALIGGSVSIFVRLFISFGQYGRFIQTQFIAQLFEIAMMCENLGTKDYEILKMQALNHIALLKAKLSAASAKIKDAHLIKNHKRALFYLYKLESICYALDVMNYYFIRYPSQSLKESQKEMSANLNELSRIFYGQKPNISKEAFSNAIAHNAHSPYIDALKIFYSKIESFTRVSSLQSQAFIENTEKKSLKAIIASLKEQPAPLFYGLRYAIAIGCSLFVAQFFQLNHGAWIALGVVSMMHPHISTIKAMGKDSILGSLIGLSLGIFLVLTLWDSPVLLWIFVINLFLVIYFKTYPFVLHSLVLMLELVLMFAFVDNHFIELIAYRFGDILLGFAFALCISKIFYPRYSADELLPQTILCLKSFATLTLDIEQQGHLRLKWQNQLVRHLSELAELIAQSKKDKKRYSARILQGFSALENDFLQLKEAMFLLCERANTTNLLIINDIKALRVRYEMLTSMLENKPYYFKTEEDERFLHKERHFYPLIFHIFSLQNNVYTFLHRTFNK